ncbi:hypothetical protein [Bergeyella zoohelcum]|uniref:hypothetical protein n=1 Tax=Bergeyella zoohelcum TaxID=1015 RepID=UPI0002F9C529|nr:hypothetical protein [Bergeyella zoohelcum]
MKAVATSTETNKTKVMATDKKQELQSKKEELSKILNPVNAEQRIKNLEILQKMADKHKFLKEKRDSLNSFMVSRDGMKERLIIMNDNNENFEITNGVIISELLEICSQKLDEMLEESNNQITSFQI